MQSGSAEISVEPKIFPINDQEYIDLRDKHKVGINPWAEPGSRKPSTLIKQKLQNRINNRRDFNNSQLIVSKNYCRNLGEIRTGGR
jgi:hypothetical protein